MSESEPCCPYAQAFTRFALLLGIAGVVLALCLARSDANAPTPTAQPGQAAVVSEK